MGFNELNGIYNFLVTKPSNKTELRIVRPQTELLFFFNFSS